MRSLSTTTLGCAWMLTYLTARNSVALVLMIMWQAYIPKQEFKLLCSKIAFLYFVPYLPANEVSGSTCFCELLAVTVLHWIKLIKKRFPEIASIFPSHTDQCETWASILLPTRVSLVFRINSLIVRRPNIDVFLCFRRVNKPNPKIFSSRFPGFFANIFKRKIIPAYSIYESIQP